MKKLFIFAVLALVAMMPYSVFAIGGTTGVTLGVGAGALTFTAPTAVTLGAITASTVNQTTTGEAANWIVDDARGVKTATTPGWSLTASATDFADVAGTSTIDVTNLKVTPNELERRNGTTSAYASYSGSQAALANISGVTLTDTDNNGTSDTVSVAIATLGNGKGNYQGDLGLSLLVPADSDAVTYNSTITFTVS